MLKIYEFEIFDLSDDKVNIGIYKDQVMKWLNISFLNEFF